MLRTAVGVELPRCYHSQRHDNQDALYIPSRPADNLWQYTYHANVLDADAEQQLD